MLHNPKVKKILHPDFARRMQIACDGNPRVPQPNHGRLRWFAEQLAKQFQDEVTIETVRKWFAGESRPRPKLMTHLASVLQVDEAWLAVGKAPEITEKQRTVRNAVASGAVNVVAGFISMCGAYPAFPTDDDTRAQDRKIDLYAVIRGAQFSFHVAVGDLTENRVRFTVPVEAAEDAFVIGVVRTGELVCLLSAGLSHGLEPLSPPFPEAVFTHSTRRRTALWWLLGLGSNQRPTD